MLGLEPLYLACEGRLVIVAPECEAPAILDALHQQPYSRDAAVIGQVTAEQPGRVVLRTEIGAETMLLPPGENCCPASAD